MSQGETGSFDMSIRNIFTRDFTLCFLAQYGISSVLFVLAPTLPIYLSKLGTGEVEIGLLIGIASIFSLILRPFVGKGLSKIPEKKFMLAGTLILSFSLAALLWAPPFWPLLVVRSFQGICAALFFTASFTLIANISPEEHRGQSIGFYFLSNNVAFALAPSLGMALINSLNFPKNFITLFLLCTGLSLCSLGLILKLETREVSGPANRPSQKQPFLNRSAVPAAVMAGLSNIIWSAMVVFFPLYAINNGVANPGLFFTAFAAVLILGRSLGGRILDLYAKEREKVILPCLTSYILSMTLLAFSRTLPMFILAAIIWGMGNTFLYPMFLTIALDRAGADRGAALGTFLAIADLGVGIGPVLMGLILNWTSYRVMFLCLSSVGVIIFLYFQFFVRRQGGTAYADL